MSQLYLDEYIIWLQSRALAENLKMLSKNVATIKVRKRDVDLDLDQLEAAARLVLEEDEMPGNIDYKICVIISCNLIP